MSLLHPAALADDVQAVDMLVGTRALINTRSRAHVLWYVCFPLDVVILTFVKKYCPGSVYEAIKLRRFLRRVNSGQK